MTLSRPRAAAPPDRVRPPRHRRTSQLARNGAHSPGRRFGHSVGRNGRLRIGGEIDRDDRVHFTAIGNDVGEVLTEGSLQLDTSVATDGPQRTGTIDEAGVFKRNEMKLDDRVLFASLSSVEDRPPPRWANSPSKTGNRLQTQEAEQCRKHGKDAQRDHDRMLVDPVR